MASCLAVSSAFLSRSVFVSACRISDLFAKLGQLVFIMGNSVSIRLPFIRERFTKPHAIESVSEFNSSNKCELFRKLFQVCLNVFPLTIDQYGEVRSCGADWKTTSMKLACAINAAKTW